MSRPTIVPTWATDATIASGPETGQTTQLEPLSGEKAQGFIADAEPPARYFNWLIGKLCEWVGLNIDVPIINWHKPSWYVRQSPFGVTDLALMACSHQRADGTAECFYSKTHNIWFLLGVDTNEHFYIAGTNGEDLEELATGSGLGKKYVAGCESGNRLLFLSATDFTSGTLELDRSNAGDFTTWTSIALPTLSHVNAVVNDIVTLANGHVIAVGADDARMDSWLSTDNGATFTRKQVDTHYAAGFQPLAGVAVGKSQRVFTWLYDTAGTNHGDRLWYSDDEGTTWTQTDALSQDKIRDVTYVSAFDKYVVTTDTGYGVATDPTANANYTWTAVTHGIAAIATNGSDILLTVDDGTTSVMTHSWDCLAGSGARAIHKNPGLVRGIAFADSPSSGFGGLGQFAALSASSFAVSLKSESRP